MTDYQIDESTASTVAQSLSEIGTSYLLGISETCKGDRERVLATLAHMVALASVAGQVPERLTFMESLNIFLDKCRKMAFMAYDAKQPEP